ncbi:MAG UNVERIFIED_CONTAM: hypothetical protein LVR18_38705 [Planctomycetaceae bacterium]
MVSDHRSQFRTERLADLQWSRGRCRTTPPRTRRISRIIPTSLAPTAGIVPAVEKRCNDYHRYSGSVGSDERSSPTHTATFEDAGTVPAFRRSVTTLTDFQVLSALTNDPSPLTLPPPKLRGLSPRPGRLSNDCCESSGSIGSDEGSVAAHPAHPEAAGIVPATGR